MDKDAADMVPTGPRVHGACAESVERCWIVPRDGARTGSR